MLFERDDLFALVEQMVGLELHEDRRPRRGHGEISPLILLQGRRGSGKTVTLNEIFAAYSNRVPQAHLDLAEEQYAGVSNSDSWDTPLLRLLRNVKWDLGVRIPDNGRLLFPRLDIAQLAVASWQRGWRPETEISREQARQQLDRARKAVTGTEQDGHDDTAVDWIADVLADLATGPVGYPANAFLRGTITAFLKRTLPMLGWPPHWLVRDVPVKWHGEFDRHEPGDGYDVLVTLAREWSDPARRSRHEYRLVAAFLADLSAQYTGWAGMRRAVRPLLLLSDADVSPAGQRFLTQAARVRAAGRTDPLVVAATEAFTGAGHPGTRTIGQSPRCVVLTPLTVDSVRWALQRADSWHLPPDLPLLIHRLTGGLPLGVGALAESITSAFPSEPGSPEQGRARSLDAADLFGLPAAHSGSVGAVPAEATSGGVPAVPILAGDSCLTVASLLLAQLIPDEQQRSRFALLSCARDGAEAQALLTLLAQRDGLRFGVPEAEEFLRDSDWLDPQPPAGRERCRCAPPGSGFFIGDAFLRTLLRHQLGVTGAPVSAVTAHGRLREMHGDAGIGLLSSTEPSRLYHCLALGEAEHVAGRLHSAFEGSDAQHWLAALVHTAAAPRPSAANPAGMDGGNTHRADAVGKSSAPTADLAYLSVSRLLHAAWYLHDPLVIPSDGKADEAIETLADELRNLARLHPHPHGHEVLFRASRDWPRRLRAWDQSYCPMIEGE